MTSMIHWQFAGRNPKQASEYLLTINKDKMNANWKGEEKYLKLNNVRKLDNAKSC